MILFLLHPYLLHSFTYCCEKFSVYAFCYCFWSSNQMPGIMFRGLMMAAHRVFLPKCNRFSTDKLCPNDELCPSLTNYVLHSKNVDFCTHYPTSRSSIATELKKDLHFDVLFKPYMSDYFDTSASLWPKVCDLVPRHWRGKTFF